MERSEFNWRPSTKKNEYRIFILAGKRNIRRFPSDFIFRLAKKEKDELVTNSGRCGYLSDPAQRYQKARKYRSWAFSGLFWFSSTVFPMRYKKWT
jgi:hypothetical protein